MPTRRGVILAAAGVGLWVAGRIFGSQPIEQIGFALLVLVAIAVAVVRLARHDLSITRRILPERAKTHQSVSVSLLVHNRGQGSAPVVTLEDQVPAGLAGRARFVLAGIEADGHREATFEIRPERRGRYEIGPLELETSDPFSLARVRARVLDPSTFIVHPRIERLVMPRDTGERRSIARSAIRQPTGPRGEDFYTIRDYVEGDDLRKIHWASTAKRGKYMIRHEETPWHTRTTIVLDDRRSAYGAFGEEVAFERAVSATASLVDLYDRAGHGFRLAGAHHPGLATGKGSDHFTRSLDLLATIEPKGQTRGDDPMLLARLAELEARRGAEATLVVVTGSLDPSLGIALARLRRVFREIVAVSFPAHRFGTADTPKRWEGEGRTREVAALIGRSGGRVVVLGPAERFATAWASFSTRSGAAEMRSDLKESPLGV